MPRPPTPAALAAYRDVLRAARQAFKNDAHALAASRAELRGKFNEAADAQGDAAAAAVADAHEAADFLRTYVVQAELNERGNYAMTVEKHHVDAVAEEGEIRGPRK